jgi:hypothetical protein
LVNQFKDVGSYLQRLIKSAWARERGGEGRDNREGKRKREREGKSAREIGKE